MVDTESGNNIKLGFIGLGNIGKPIAANLVNAGSSLTVYDKAGTEDRTPKGALCADSVEAVAGQAQIVFLSLPNGDIVRDIAHTIAAAPVKPEIVVDLSTIGTQASNDVTDILQRSGVDYLDCPVSGGTAAAKIGNISLMCAGKHHRYQECQPFFKAIAGKIFYLGDKTGLGQTLKLANNFLSAITLAATSEAVKFGVSAGLDMATMLEVLNASSGRSAATEDKFPKEVLTERFAAGFHNTLMAKDLKLYRESAMALELDGILSKQTFDIWSQFADETPNTDFTEIYHYIGKQMVS